MKTRFFILTTLALAPFPSSAWAQTTPDNRRIVPGERIGRIFLGDSQAAVRRRLGVPSKTFNLGPGLTSEVWRGSRRPDTDGFYTLEVVYRRGVVRQIETTNPLFKTSSGFDIDDSLASWKARLGKPVVRAFVYPAKGEQLKQYHDWRSTGIAMELIQDGEEMLRETIIVHPRGVPVLPDRGGIEQ